MQKITCLYITFNGLTDPLGQSQVLPYLKDLSQQGIKFYLISLEKDLKKAGALADGVKSFGIKWYRLKYFQYGAVGVMLNILQCFLWSFYLLATKKINVIHARSYYPLFSVLLLKKIFGAKLIFDMRGFWPEELVDSGRIKKNRRITNC